MRFFMKSRVLFVGVLCGLAVLSSAPASWGQTLDERVDAVTVEPGPWLDREVVVPKSGESLMPRFPTLFFQETFEGAFPNPYWSVGRDSGSADVWWGDSDYRDNGGNWSLWCAENGSASPAYGGDVPYNTDTKAIMGPFNLSGYSSGHLEYDLWLETESGFDEFCYYASINGVNFYGHCTTTNTNWVTRQRNWANWTTLGNLYNYSNVWFMFKYESDGSIKYEGAYLDNVELWGQSGSPPSGCTPSSTVACLNSNRFRVTINWRDFSNNTGSARVAPAGTDDSGIFYFFTSDNWEVLFKVLDGCSFNNRYWVFFAATTDVQFTATVTDTLYNTTRTFYNSLGHPANAVTDTSAFATCP